MFWGEGWTSGRVFKYIFAQCCSKMAEPSIPSQIGFARLHPGHPPFCFKGRPANAIEFEAQLENRAKSTRHLVEDEDFGEAVMSHDGTEGNFRIANVILR